MSTRKFRAALDKYLDARTRNHCSADMLWHELETSYAPDLARWLDQHPEFHRPGQPTGQRGRPRPTSLQRRLDRHDRAMQRRARAGRHAPPIG